MDNAYYPKEGFVLTTLSDGGGSETIGRVLSSNFWR